MFKQKSNESDLAYASRLVTLILSDSRCSDRVRKRIRKQVTIGTPERTIRYIRGVFRAWRDSAREESRQRRFSLATVQGGVSPLV